MPKRHAILPVKDVNQQVFVRKLARYLKEKGNIDVPQWTTCVKTGIARELPPVNPDWLYIRMASIARRVYMRCPTGVGALSRRYGGINNRKGVNPEHTAKASKKIIRFSLQQLERMGWLRKAARGRKLTNKGRGFMNEFSGRVRRSSLVSQYYRRRKRVNRQRLREQNEKNEENNVTQGGPTEYDNEYQNNETQNDVTQEEEYN